MKVVALQLHIIHSTAWLEHLGVNTVNSGDFYSECTRKTSGLGLG